MDMIQEHVVIGALETEIVHSDKLDDFLVESILSEKITPSCKKIISGMMNCCKQYDLQLGIIKRQYPQREFYLPTLCLLYENRYYHVFYSENWICRECGCDNGKVLMPLVETGDGGIYPNRNNVEIADCFKKEKCKKCGKILQNHLMRLN